jgi:arylsulfatase A-like enzyme
VTSDAPISLTDLLVTTAALLGLSTEATSPDGADFSPALLGKAWTRPLQCPLVALSSRGAHTLRQGSWKFISQLGSGGFSSPQHLKAAVNGPDVQLYELTRDPGESTNLADSEPLRVAEFRRQLTALLAGNPTARP